jgi:hypothetical protein
MPSRWVIIHSAHTCLRTIGSDGKPIWSDVPRNWKVFKSSREAEDFIDRHEDAFKDQYIAPGYIDEG